MTRLDQLRTRSNCSKCGATNGPVWHCGDCGAPLTENRRAYGYSAAWAIPFVIIGIGGMAEDPATTEARALFTGFFVVGMVLVFWGDMVARTLDSEQERRRQRGEPSFEPATHDILPGWWAGIVVVLVAGTIPAVLGGGTPLAQGVGFGAAVGLFAGLMARNYLQRRELWRWRITHATQATPTPDTHAPTQDATGEESRSPVGFKAPVSSVCRQCRKRNEGGNFCGYCGTPLDK